jgi:hypothetical protein
MIYLATAFDVEILEEAVVAASSSFQTGLEAGV